MRVKSILKSGEHIDEDLCVISLVRKFKEGDPIYKTKADNHEFNKEHVFILVEGLTGLNKVFLRRYDLVMENHRCLVIINDRYNAINPQDAANVLNFKLLDYDQITGIDWLITKKQATQLDNNVRQSKRLIAEYTANYNACGENATLPQLSDIIRGTNPKSAEKTSNSFVMFSEKTLGPFETAMIKEALSPAGQNCFDWAINMLSKIGDKRITESLPHSPFQIIAAKPSSLIPGKP